MIKIKKHDDSTISITIKSENGICPFCNGTGWETITLIDTNTKVSIRCYWCKFFQGGREE